MQQHLQKIIAVLGISISLSIAMPPSLAANIENNIELATALLRLPCGILEYDLRNDTSRAADLKRAALHSVRLINDLYAKANSQSHSFWWFIYDVKEIVENLHIALSKSGQSDQQTKLDLDKEYKILRRFVLPTLEMVFALARTKNAARKLPRNGAQLSSNGITLARLGQMYFETPKNSAQRRFIVALLILSTLTFISNICHLERNPNVNNRKIFRSDDGKNIACAICQEKRYDNPHCLDCGHVFCLDCITGWWQSKGTCPTCRQRSTDPSPV
jgi:hypothetical protein